jgi:hypothetical protein
MIARAVNDDEYIIVASIDLSSTLDLVNIDLLLQRLKIIGLPEDLIALISAWLRNILYYVSINVANSTFYYLFPWYCSRICFRPHPVRYFHVSSI